MSDKKQGELTEEGTKKVEENQQKDPSYAKDTSWLMPCGGDISSYYGERIHPVYKERKFHNGWDIPLPIGTPIKAVADGRVIAVGSASGYGQWVVLDHGIINGVPVTSEYGHISKTEVKYGQKIKQGTVVALSGNEGTSTGPHLHLTIREGKFKGKGVDPFKYIKRN